MDKTLEINEGLRLMVLVRLDGRKVPEIAKELGFDPGYISKLQKMDNLPNATRKKLAEYFKVPETYFTEPNPIFEPPRIPEVPQSNLSDDVIDSLVGMLLDQVHSLRKLKSNNR